MPFTSDTAKYARACQAPKPPFDKKAWCREWMARERARRIAVGVCAKCGLAVEIGRAHV